MDDSKLLASFENHFVRFILRISGRTMIISGKITVVEPAIQQNMPAIISCALLNIPVINTIAPRSSIIGIIEMTYNVR